MQAVRCPKYHLGMFIFGPLPDDPMEALAGELDAEAIGAQVGLYTLARAGYAVLSSIEQIAARHDLTPTQFRLLMVLRFVHPDGVSMSRAADALDIKPPSLTEIVRSAPDLFVRSTNGADHRRVMLSASPEGHRRLGGALPQMAAHAVSLENALGADAWNTLVGEADRLFEVIQEGSP